MSFAMAPASSPIDGAGGWYVRSIGIVAGG
jgi:hypothetical protein